MDNLGTSPAELAALIEELKTKLSAAQVEVGQERADKEKALTQLEEVQGNLFTAQKDLAISKDEAQKTLAAQVVLTQAAEAKIAVAETSRDELAKKFEDLYGPIEPGIKLGPPPYITQDGSAHVTLQDARMHLFSTLAGVTKVQAKHLVNNAKDLVPLIQKLIGAGE